MMSEILIYPTYFPSVSHYVAMAQAQAVTFEVDDNFQKQTNRNRMYIYSPNGVQLLHIPIKHSKTAHQKTRDVQLETAENWQKQHFKSLEAAYRSSPFFEYFEDAFVPFFEKKHKFLMDLNFEGIEIVNKCLQFSVPTSKTTEYFHEVSGVADLRKLAIGKKDTAQFEPYNQVFGEKFGYLNNLSVLDVLFNEGRHALAYLQRQRL